MSTSPAPSASRGDVTLQPSYFTSSLYVESVRMDIERLIQLFSEQYTQTEPFTLFKKLWCEQGWSWLHFKVLDGRGRQSFVTITERLFIERLVEPEDLLARVVALFGLYTFYQSQPSTSTPSLHYVLHIDIPINVYRALIALPLSLTDQHLLPLQRYVTYVLSMLLDAQVFHILPDSEYHAQNPALLPRELFVQDGQESAVITELVQSSSAVGSGVPPKKKGRPSKREKMRKAKDALVALDKYLDKNGVPSVTASFTPFVEEKTSLSDSAATSARSTHALITHPPITSRNNYISQKTRLLDALYSGTYAESSGSYAEPQKDLGRTALYHTNDAVLARLKKIDEMAAEKGLEVGGEGGEKTGLARVERAVQEMYGSVGLGGRGGILALLEGAGMAEDEF